jgi:5'-3' exonuclease
MGKELSEDETTKKTWDSNAITPGTPFMDLLALSLRYWVVKKMNSDSGWKQVRDVNFHYYQYTDIVADTSNYFGFKCSW